MSSHPYPITRALVVALAGLALLAPQSIAQTATDGDGVQQWPHTAESRAYTAVEKPVVASPGTGAPAVATPRVETADPGFAWGAAAIGAAATVGLIGLGALGAAAVGRTRPRVAR
jgi:hypothetical protein